MNRLLILLFIPTTLFSNEISINELIKIDVVVTVESQGEKVFNVDLTKYTVDGKGVSIKLKGYDGVINAMLTPKVEENEIVELSASCEVRDLEGSLLSKRDKLLKTNYNEKIIFYPLGGLGKEPRVLMELTINKFTGL